MILYTICLFIVLQVTSDLPGGTARTEPVYSSGKSMVTFYSEAPLEDIEARSSQLRGAITMETGRLLFVVPIRSFEFEKALMQKHFNEQYLESDKYPEARFEGRFDEAPVIVDGSKVIRYEGRMTLHGLSRQVTGKATLTREGEDIHGYSTIKIRLEDYDIKIPRMVIKNIAEVVDVKISVTFHPE